MDSTVDQLASDIRQLWVNAHRDWELRTTGTPSDWGHRFMTKWDGGVSEDGRVHGSVWVKIALFVMANELDLEVLITAVFYKQLYKPPYPNMAHGAAALERYRVYTSPGTQLELRNELIYALESQKQRATSDVLTKTKYYNLDDNIAWRITIGSKSIPLTPLFRYCVAVNQQWSDIAEQYYPTARKQYKQRPKLYDDVWGEWIPPDFKTKALAVKACET